MKILKLAVVPVLIVLFGVVAPAQSPATGRVLREKLGHSQKFLEAILTSNFAQLERESAALSKATQSSAWSVLRGPEYVRQSERFLKSLQEMDAAERTPWKVWLAAPGEPAVLDAASARLASSDRGV